MTLFLTHAHVDQIHHEARGAYPQECCGVIVGRDTANRRVVDHLLPLPNVAPPDQRNRRFEIDPLSLMKIERALDGTGLSVIGFYHSHPDHPAVPSETDLREAWPVYSYLIQSVKNDECETLLSWTLDESSVKFDAQHVVFHDQPADPD